MSGLVRGFILCSALLVILFSIMPNFTFAASPECPIPYNPAINTNAPTFNSELYNAMPNGYVFDLQQILSYTNSITEVSDNVTATWPAADPTQPAYLVNGYTIVGNDHYWYQLGLSNGWYGSDNPEIHVVYEVWCNLDSIAPIDGGAGDLDFIGKVNQGDNITLTMFLQNNNVIMFAKDRKTGAFANILFNAHGATVFQGSTDGIVDEYGQFTGLMTEWYHYAPYYGNEAYQKYVPVIPNNDPSWLGAEETAILLSNGIISESYVIPESNTPGPVAPAPSVIWTAYADGTGPGEEYFANGTFITGVSQTASGQVSDPVSVVFSPDGYSAYVDSQGTDSVSVINVATNTTVKTIQLGETPWSIAINPSGTTLYVAVTSSPKYGAVTGTSSIDIIDTQTDEITGSIPVSNAQIGSLLGGDDALDGELVPQAITDLVINQAGTYAFGTSQEALVEKIDLMTNTVVGTLDAYTSPMPGSTPGSYKCSDPAYGIEELGGGIAIDPTGTYVYVPGGTGFGGEGGWEVGVGGTLQVGSPCEPGAQTASGYASVAQINTNTLGVSIITCGSSCPGSGSGTAEASQGVLYSTGAVGIGSGGSGEFGGWHGMIGIPGGSFMQTDYYPYSIQYSPPSLVAAGKPQVLYAIMCNAIPDSPANLGYVSPPPTDSYLYANGAEILSSYAGCPAVNGGWGDSNNGALAIDPNPSLPFAYIANYYNKDIIIVNTQTNEAVGTIPV